MHSMKHFSTFAQKTPKHVQKMIAPHLNPGDTIGIIAPAGPITEAQLRSAEGKIEHAGFRALSADNTLNRRGYLAGSDEDRATQINSMFANPDVKAIICARGGYGTTRILDLLDYDLIARNPKIIGGYSDITALTMAIWKKTNLVTFHSSMLVPEDTGYTRTSMWNIFGNGKKGTRILCEPGTADGVIMRPGHARGTLIGGNLTLLEQLIGTQYDYSLHNKILFVEEINEPPYKVDRMLTHLRNSKNLSGLKGIVFGKMQGCEAQGDNSLSLDEVLTDFVSGLNIPVVKDFSFGHVKSRCTLPVGAKVSLRTDKMEIRLLEDVVA